MSHQPTVTVRIVGWASLVTSPGGQGLIVTNPEFAADALLRNEPVHIPGALIFVKRVRRVIAQRALAGAGPDGDGVNFGQVIN